VDQRFDYVVVGAGSAGCVLANRLSEDPNTRVCLLEAGPEDRHPLIHVPIGLLWLMHSRRLNWRYWTVPQAELAHRRLYCPRGRMLGGSSSSNAMCYTRGHPADYDRWRDLGNPGWGYEDVLPYFLRAENQERGASPFHGVGGPLHVCDLRSPSRLSLAFVEAALEAGYAANDDFNGAQQEGVGLYQVTQCRGLRCSAARAYLAPVRARRNLTVMTHAHVTRIVLNKRRAVAVALRHEGVSRTIGAAAEVILSAGAIGSPQLLMLSGIGPAEHLRERGVPPVLDRPEVGRNLQDHLDVIVVHACKTGASYGFTAATPLRLPLAAAQLAWSRRGMLTSNGAEAGGFMRSSLAETRPDLQFHFTPIRLRRHGLDVRFLFGHGYSLHVCGLRPKSRGMVTLNGPEPDAHPCIDPRYLSDAADLATLVAGFKAARRILRARAFDRYRGEELSPGPSVQTDGEIEAFIRQQAETIYHPVGTCRMGADAAAVVDPRLRVVGIERLRVVDASIMPTLVAGNTNAPVIMIAEKAAELIRRDGS
jgi:choline dehydrogenase-like flavoprotein